MFTAWQEKVALTWEFLQEAQISSGELRDSDLFVLVLVPKLLGLLGAEFGLSELFLALPGGCWVWLIGYPKLWRWCGDVVTPRLCHWVSHWAFSDLGDVRTWSVGWVLWLFMFWRKNSVHTPSLQTCPLYSTVLMHLIFFLLIGSRQQNKFRCVGEAKHLKAD